MSVPTTSIYFSDSTPAAPPGNQICVPQTDNEVPQQAVTFYPEIATADLVGVVKPDGTTITMDPDGTIHAVGGTGGGGGTSSSGGVLIPVIPSGAKDGSNTQFILPAPLLAGTYGLAFLNGVLLMPIGTNAEYAVQGIQFTTKYPPQATDRLVYYYIQGVPNSEGGGGGGVVPSTSPPLRGSNIASSNSASSISVTLPAGTLAGDLAVCFAGGAWSISVPGGWTVLESHNDLTWFARAFYKTLTSGDIAAGNVSVSFAGTFDCVLGIATFIGGTGGIRESEYGSNSGTAFTITNVTSSAVLNTDAILYFATGRAATAAATITPSSGSATTLRSATTTNSISTLADQGPPNGVLSVANSWANVGAGAWAAQVVVMAP